MRVDISSFPACFTDRRSACPADGCYVRYINYFIVFWVSSTVLYQIQTEKYVEVCRLKEIFYCFEPCEHIIHERLCVFNRVLWSRKKVGVFAPTFWTSEVFSFAGTVFAFADIIFYRSSSHLLRNFDNIVILKTNEIYVIMFKNTIKIIARLLSESINAMWSFLIEMI